MESTKPAKIYPNWVKEIARKYFSRNISQFIIHGNVNDYVCVQEGAPKYLKLRDFLAEDLFRNRNLILFYDRATGITFRTPEMRKDFVQALDAYDTVHKTDFAKAWPKDPARAFALLEMYFKLRINDGKSIVFIMEYAETIVPMASGAQMGAEDRTISVFLQKWATESIFLNNDVTFILTTENTSELNQQFLRNPHNFEISIPYPDESARQQYIDFFIGKYPNVRELLEMDSLVLAKNTAGLGIVHLKGLLGEVIENNIRFTYEDLKQKKKELIESEAGGLLEFIESKRGLESVAGHKYAKKHLMEVSIAIRSGRNDVIPMGYLVSGPVGTGKTYLVTCFAKDIGVPMVMLKNFRSKWQGSTEGNLEKVLKILKAMTPVAVMIDEADAYLGDRDQQGDSGVSNRVFSMLANFMANTEHRGRIIWFLMTARPDLLPVDFKRQGRAEEHIGLFYPETVAEKKELFEIMLRKTDLDYVDLAQFDDAFYEGLMIQSGADMEAALTRAKFKAAANGKEQVGKEDILNALEDFLPPTYPEEIELMNYAAVLECTSRELLPEHFRNLTRDEVVQKVMELKLRVG